MKFEEHVKAKLLIPPNYMHEKEKAGLVHIEHYPLGVDRRRLLFEGLLDVGEGIEDILTNKVAEKQLLHLTKWIHLVERQLFSLTEEFANASDIIDLDIHMREIECEIGLSNLCKVVQLY